MWSCKRCWRSVLQRWRGLNFSGLFFLFHFCYLSPPRQCQMLHVARKLFQEHFRHCFPCEELWFSQTDSPTVRCQWGSIFGSLARLRLYNNEAMTRGNLLADLYFFPHSRKVSFAQFHLTAKPRSLTSKNIAERPSLSVWGRHWDDCPCLNSSRHSWSVLIEEFCSSKELDAPEVPTWPFQSL